MYNFIHNEEGSILGIALLYFLIFSIIGMTVLELTNFFRLDSLGESHFYENKYAVESGLNVAIWRANTGEDSLANYDNNGVISEYIDSTRILTVSTSTWNLPYEVIVELKPVHSFERIESYTTKVDTNKGTINYMFGRDPLKFIYLPDIDTAYFRQNAVQIHTVDVNYNSALTAGIHYIDGATVELRSGASLTGSLVGVNNAQIRFKKNGATTIHAGTDTGGVYLPVIVTDSSSTVTFDKRQFVNGAVFMERDRNINIDGTFTGPIIGHRLAMKKSGIIDDQDSDIYYVWPPGFGDLYSYDWPKMIKKGSWRN